MLWKLYSLPCFICSMIYCWNRLAWLIRFSLLPHKSSHSKYSRLYPPIFLYRTPSRSVATIQSNVPVLFWDQQALLERRRGYIGGRYRGSRDQMRIMSTSSAIPGPPQESYGEIFKAFAAKEIVQIVDENNQPIGGTSRSIMRRDRLIHRATYAFIKNSNNYFYVQKRSELKDYCPGYWDPTPGGVVAEGESYASTNAREVEEEMGISGAQMEHVFTFYYEDERVRCFGDAWELVWDGPLKLQKEEVSAVELMSMQEILDRYERGEPFTPDSLYACRKYYDERCGSLATTGPKTHPIVITSDE